MTAITEFERNHRRTMIGYTISFAVWGGALTVLMFIITDPSKSHIAGIVGGITVLSWLVWAYFLIRLFVRMRRLKADPDLNRTVNDERAKSNALRAFAAAFWGLLAAAAFITVIAAFFHFDGNPAAIATGVIWIGVTIALAAYLVFDGRDEA